MALEAGNSPQMIFRHYRELVRPADAEKWSAVTLASVEAAKAARECAAEGKIVKLPGVRTKVLHSEPQTEATIALH